jgi:alkylation response protein AidB-like acyl-CoA dehydrogenase
MDFALSEADEAYIGTIRELGGRLRNDEVVARDAAGSFPGQVWTELANVGLTGLPVPARYGGAGATAVRTVAALAALGEVCLDNGLMFALGAHLWACTDPIASFGSDEQKERWLPGLCDGSMVAAHAATEPGAGSDAAAISTTAVRSGTGWVLNGRKTYVTNAPVADVFLVTAVTDPAGGLWGLSVFLIPRQAPGLRVGPVIDKDGLRTALMAEVVLDNCLVGDEALLGAAGAGMGIFSEAMRRERTFILAPALGVMKRLVEQCARYASDRRQFGAPIADFQSVSNRLAEMHLRLHTSRQLALWVARLTDRREAGPEHAAMVKLHLAEAFVASAQDAVQIHGAYGYTRAAEMMRMVRDALGARIYSGTSDIQRNVISHACMPSRRPSS